MQYIYIGFTDGFYREMYNVFLSGLYIIDSR